MFLFYFCLLSVSVDSCLEDCYWYCIEERFCFDKDIGKSYNFIFHLNVWRLQYWVIRNNVIFFVSVYHKMIFQWIIMPMKMSIWQSEMEKHSMRQLLRSQADQYASSPDARKTFWGKWKKLSSQTSIFFNLNSVSSLNSSSSKIREEDYRQIQTNVPFLAPEILAVFQNSQIFHDHQPSKSLAIVHKSPSHKDDGRRHSRTNSANEKILLKRLEGNGIKHKSSKNSKKWLRKIRFTLPIV